MEKSEKFYRRQGLYLKVACIVLTVSACLSSIKVLDGLVVDSFLEYLIPGVILIVGYFQYQTVNVLLASFSGGVRGG